MEVLMSTEPPLVCALGAGDLTVRLAEMADLGQTALLDARNEGTRVELRFAPHAGVRPRVDAFVTAESQCCAFLTMRVRDLDDAVLLTIDAPEGGELALADFIRAFGGQPYGSLHCYR